MENRRFALRYDPVSRAAMALMGLGPSRSHVEVGPDEVRVRMGWAFSARLPRPYVAAVRRAPDVLATRGVHGWRGRWLVNGSGRGIVEVDLHPPGRARTGVVRARVSRLRVSVEEPDALVDALAPG